MNRGVCRFYIALAANVMPIETVKTFTTGRWQKRRNKKILDGSLR